MLLSARDISCWCNNMPHMSSERCDSKFQTTPILKGVWSEISGSSVKHCDQNNVHPDVSGARLQTAMMFRWEL